MLPQFPRINAADPICRYLELVTRLPLAYSHPPLTSRRILLRSSLNRPDTHYMPPPHPPVISHPLNIQPKRRSGIRTHKNGELIPSANAGMRAIPFDPRTAIFGLRIDARILQNPIHRPLI